MSKRIVFIFALSFLLTLFVTAPAAILDWSLQRASQGKILLANANGTIWNGSAIPALRTSENRFVTLPFLHWEISLQSIFSGKILIRLLWDNQQSSQATEALLSFNQLELRHTLLRLPARVLEEVSPILKAAQFRGELQIESSSLVFSKRGMEGTALVDWRQASSALSPVAPLGDYHLELVGTGERLNIALTTHSGMLFLEGEGNWLASRGLEFHGKAHATSGNNNNLADLLSHLGPEISPGVHDFNLIPP
jgi:general secretion pathway protein N